MTATSYVTQVGGENFTKVEISAAGYIAVPQQFRIYNTIGQNIHTEEMQVFIGIAEYSFYLEVVPLIYEHNPNRDGSFKIEHWQKDFGASDYRKVDEKTVSYSLQSNSYTRPSVGMNLSMSPQSNGYCFTNITKVQATFSGSTKYGAGISTYNLHVDGKNYGSPYTSDTFKNGGWQTITGTITDTRGFTASVSQRVWVMERMPAFDAISGNTYLNNAINYTYTPPNKDAYSRFSVACKVGDSYVDVEDIDLGQSSTKKNGSLTLSRLAIFYGNYPNTIKVPLRFTLRTYQDAYSTKLAEEYSKDLTLYIPDNSDTKPQISNVSITPSLVLLNDSSLFIKSKNGAVVSSECSGKYNASISSVIWVTENEAFANGAASDVFTTYGQVAITIQATDSRGFENAASYTITVQDYSPPFVSTISGAERYIVRRSDANGAANDNGTYLRIELGKRWTKLGGKNKCKLLMRKRPSGGDWGESILLLAEGSASDDYAQTRDEQLNPLMLYTIEIVAEDSLGERDTYYVTIPSEKVYMERNGQRGSISFGGRIQKDNAFEVYQTAYFHSNVVMNFNGVDFPVQIRGDGTLYVDTTQISMEELL